MAKEKLVIKYLDKLKTLLILDGLDELQKISLRESTISDMRRLSANLRKSFVVLTSRTGDFIYNIDNTDVYELSPLRENQLYDFARKWLGSNSKATDFISKLRSSPFYDTSLRPLTLGHLCAIFERIGTIPEKPKTVYRKIVNLLLEEWDQQRSVKRQSRYAGFEIDRKFEFLSNLAFELTSTMQRSVFTKTNLERTYLQICDNYDLPRNEVKEVVNEIESHTGLFIQSGYDNYEFAHKSLQEYLTAEYLVKLPTIPTDHKLLLRIPEELALAVAISSNSSEYFSELVLKRIATLAPREDFYRAFLSRLLTEKPEFNRTIRVSLAFAKLYSMYIEHCVIRAGQLQFFYEDNLFVQFEAAVKRILKRNGMQTITSDYKVVYQYNGLEDGKILRLKRVKMLPSKLRLSSLLDYLYFRKEFFSDEHNLFSQSCGK